MRQRWRLAFRYFTFRGIPRLIHLLAGISILGIASSTAALVLILSVFNGFTEMVEGLYNRMEPHILIEPAQGKWLVLDSIPMEQLKQIEGVVAISPMLMEKALLTYGDEQVLAMVEAVTPEYGKVMDLDSALVMGNVRLERGSRPYAVVGAGIARRLGLETDFVHSTLGIMFPREPRKGLINPTAAFLRVRIPVEGIFSVQRQYDEGWVMVPYAWLARKMKKEGQAHAIAIRFDQWDAELLKRRQQEIAKILGKGYLVKDFYRLHATLFRIFNIEKLAVFLILTLVIGLAGFNISAAVLMLTMERQRHFAVLQVMGASRKLLQWMVVGASMFLTLIGGGVGLVIGYVVGRLQQAYGLVKLTEGTSFVAKAYPVAFQVVDFGAILGVIVAIGWLAAWLPIRTATSPVSLEKLRLR